MISILPSFTYIYISIYCILNIGSLWRAVKWCPSWLPVVQNVNNFIWTISRSGRWLLCYCFVCPCDVLLVGFMYVCSVFYLCFSLHSHLFRKYIFLKPKLQKQVFSLTIFGWQLLSGETAKMTLCLCSQLNLTVHAESAGKCWHFTSPMIPSALGVHLQDCFVCQTWESFPHLFMGVQNKPWTLSYWHYCRATWPKSIHHAAILYT